MRIFFPIMDVHLVANGKASIVDYQVIIAGMVAKENTECLGRHVYFHP
jgi:hypothetical protein